MTALLRAELARARARPYVWGVVAVLTLGAVGHLIIGWWDTRPPTSAQVAAASVALAAAEDRWQEEGAALVAQCVERQEAGVGDGVDLGCADMSPVLEQFLPSRPGLAHLLEQRVTTVGLMVVIGMLMTGVGLVTAEFATGSMSTWLTFTPRRGRVFVSKLVAACATSVVVGLLPVVVVVVGLAAVSAWHGTDTAVDGATAAALAGRAARWFAVGLGATVLGVGLGFAVRHAAAVTGIVVWWVAAVESTLPLVLPSARWLPLSTNVRAWTAGHATYNVPSCVADANAPGGEVCELVARTVGAGQGALVALTLVALAVVAGWLSFRLRDVT
ncbi:ABC transporter permease subunit [Cellulomonas xiejunii]|uniref:ABC transporter permease subunit n=1 Tax=Cellulomonas xiejunii TaxID=2968083 RepID=A0ABY5KR67_9CELL|nr:ABC transporter permease subunit [Cellulomonas xiejunii]MCC2321650.1 ABC transporter permease subunit [Cellulomonas xiejunii]UUI72964.1 ABC transporter permease subunit [Cellulomonas xiejunii]